MKTVKLKTKIVALALAAMFTTHVAFATPVNDENPQPQEVSYAGSVNDLPVYRVELNNANKATYLVSIKDDRGNILYSERISGSSIVRNYQLEEALSSEYSLTFEINNLTEKKRAIYSVNKTKRFFEEVEVSKLK